MAIWYEVEKTEDGINNFLDCNWGFHDFRAERIEYVPEMDMVEIYLKYDTRKEGVLLRFAWIKDMHINTQHDYDADWIYNSCLFITEKGTLIWVDEDITELEFGEVKHFATWVEAERMFWAVTDEEGNLVEMPEERINQEWNIDGKVVKKHFVLKEFSNKWDQILKPYYER